MRKVYLDAINGVLTPEQQAKLKELQTQRQREVSMRGKMQGNKKQMATPPVGGLKGLNLTDDQKQKIKALTEEYKVKSKELALQHREALNNVYTPEQQAKLKDMWKNAPVHKFSKGERGGMKLNDANAAKLKSLKKSYDKDKEAI
ncbi:MAG: hypothetical protein LBN74_07105, partial [Prevotella sp.]|jgi:Spy/CpxP family protein refolding chaperone|nr:hypothetical protein [Prevotella sp.]